jgi:hypothetical protein
MSDIANLRSLPKSITPGKASNGRDIFGRAVEAKWTEKLVRIDLGFGESSTTARVVSAEIFKKTRNRNMILPFDTVDPKMSLFEGNSDPEAKSQNINERPVVIDDSA